MPPGGRAVCEEDQLAICRVKDGHPETECKDPPTGRFHKGAVLNDAQRQFYFNWALSEITGQQRSPSTPVTPSDSLILKRGVYRDAWTGETVTFRLPDFVLKNPPKNRGNPGSGLPPPGYYPPAGYP